MEGRYNLDTARRAIAKMGSSTFAYTSLRGVSGATALRYVDKLLELGEIVEVEPKKTRGRPLRQFVASPELKHRDAPTAGPHPYAAIFPELFRIPDFVVRGKQVHRMRDGS